MMMHKETGMRTTLTIDDDILVVARHIAERDDRTVGEVISALARKALEARAAPGSIRNGVPLLPVKHGTNPVTLEMVNRLRDEGA